MSIPQKLLFDQFYHSMLPVLNYPDLDRKLIDQVKAYVDQLILSNHHHLADRAFLKTFLNRLGPIKKMYDCCHYCLSEATLCHLKPILIYFLKS